MYDDLTCSITAPSPLWPEAIDPGPTSSPSKTLDFIQQFKAQSKASVESIIALGVIVHDAAMSLEPEELSRFGKGVDLDPKGSTFRKHKAIGGKAERLKELSGKLPNCWTTIYRLAILSEDDLLKLKNSDVVNPSVTMAEISAFLQSHQNIQDQDTEQESGDSDQGYPIRITLQFPRLTKIELQTIKDELLSLCESKGARITVDQNAENETNCLSGEACAGSGDAADA